MWTASALRPEARQLRGRAWRVVEAQYAASTRRITDTRAEQERLEALLEDTKPPQPGGTAPLHYLLATPFRYGPLNPHGSRFRPANAPWGVFYAAVALRTALAELAYHRLRFFLRSQGTALPTTEERLTAFSIDYRSEHGLDLTRPPLNRDVASWTDPDDYGPTQGLAQAARSAGVEILRSASVRDPQRGGRNISLLSPSAFAHPRPRSQQSWSLHLGPVEVTASRARATAGEVFSFPRNHWKLT